MAHTPNKTEKAFSPIDCTINDKSYKITICRLPDDCLTTAWPWQLPFHNYMIIWWLPNNCLRLPGALKNVDKIKIDFLLYKCFVVCYKRFNFHNRKAIPRIFYKKLLVCWLVWVVDSGYDFDDIERSVGWL